MLCTCHHLPQGRGGPWAVGGGIGDFVGILQDICAPVGGGNERPLIY